jgi:hypothetical protein
MLRAAPTVARHAAFSRISSRGASVSARAKKAEDDLSDRLPPDEKSRND